MKNPLSTILARRQAQAEFLPPLVLPDVPSLADDRCTVEITDDDGVIQDIQGFPNRQRAAAFAFQFNHEHPDGMLVATIHNRPRSLTRAEQTVPAADRYVEYAVVSDADGAIR